MVNKFLIKLTLEQLKGLVRSKPNHANFEFHKELIKELETLLQPTCGTCELHCGNEWCVTKQQSCEGDKDE